MVGGEFVKGEILQKKRDSKTRKRSGGPVQATCPNCEGDPGEMKKKEELRTKISQCRPKYQHTPPKTPEKKKRESVHALRS